MQAVRQLERRVLQVRILSVLIRYDALYQDQKHKEWAEKILITFELLIEEGGVKDPTYGEWYDEYTGQERGHVLNGFMYALISIWECGDYFKSSKANDLFKKGIQTLNEKLPEFELDSKYFKWSRYDNKCVWCSGIHYHKRVHVYQLKIFIRDNKRSCIEGNL
ncbi:MAG: hypothetical protein A2042_06625 [Candidatus Schekmanbacteria bacterium GWA2_38_11]|uniref:D-glucuronyl C5-epimerase C-terminal domain-containing protein n=1 Tax=Candidatus Schekmanbacteria bacterium GWA2_38_11 TaxID=1817876 RepID=A0A1F7RM77_9BACT|nr:MAG: hypothetical protein A2042_06625 [Candidatus Schekmanbacteria bacterium GWA2_38_11]